MTNVPNTTQDAPTAGGDDLPPLPAPPKPPWPAPGPCERVTADAAGQAARVRIARTQMLRAIGRECFAVDQDALPAPVGVRFADVEHVVALDFDTVAEATAWADYLGAMDAKVAASEFGGNRWEVYTASVVWRGFKVTVGNCARVTEAVQPEPVSA